MTTSKPASELIWPTRWKCSEEGGSLVLTSLPCYVTSIGFIAMGVIGGISLLSLYGPDFSFGALSPNAMTRFSFTALYAAMIGAVPLVCVGIGLWGLLSRTDYKFSKNEMVRRISVFGFSDEKVFESCALVLKVEQNVSDTHWRWEIVVEGANNRWEPLFSEDPNDGPVLDLNQPNRLLKCLSEITGWRIETRQTFDVAPNR